MRALVLALALATRFGKVEVTRRLDSSFRARRQRARNDESVPVGEPTASGSSRSSEPIVELHHVLRLKRLRSRYRELVTEDAVVLR